MGSSEYSKSDSKANYFSGETGRVFSLDRVKCSSCGGAVDISSGQEQVICQYCGNQIAVDLTSLDFVIDKGVLTKYRGESREVVVPNHVTAIGPAAFIMQDSLTGIVLPDGVRELQGSTFRGCRSLETIVLPEKLEMIPDCAFCGCESLATITLPGNLKFLGSMVFDGCKSLTSIEIPPGVRAVERNVFSNCNKLETIVLSEDTELRGYLPDENCPELPTIVIRDSCTGEKVAEQPQPEGARSTAPPDRPGEEIEAAGSMNKINCSSCGGTINITEDQGQAICPHCNATFIVNFESPDFVIDQGVLVKYTGKSREVVAPENVRAIGLLAFYEQNSLTKIVLPDSVTELQGGFMGCRGLETLILSNSLESIPDAAFQNCVSLKTIILPGNLKFVGNMAFGNCSSLTSIEIPPKVKFLDKMVFYNCPSLETIIRYESTELTGDFFVMCPKLSTLIIRDSVTGEIIEERRFVLGEDGAHFEVPVWSTSNRAADGIPGSVVRADELQPEHAEAPSSVSNDGLDPHTWLREIRCASCGATIQITGGRTLVNCTFCNSQFSISLDNPDFIIDQGVLVKYIGVSREVVVPDAARTIGALAFYQQSSLKKIVLPNSVTELEGTFAGCYELDTIVLSDNIQTIPSGTFKDCVSLTTIVLPRNLRCIERLAFMNCRSLTTVELPAAITSLDEMVFYECGSLETIVCYKGAALRREAFVGCPGLSTFVVLDPETGEKLSE